MFSNIVAYEKLNHIDSFTITTFATTFGAIFAIPFFLIDVSYNFNNFNLNYNSIFAVI